MREFEINVFNLRAYTEGKIEGEVFRLPMNQEELQRRLRELLGKDDCYEYGKLHENRRDHRRAVY